MEDNKTAEDALKGLAVLAIATLGVGIVLLAGLGLLLTPVYLVVFLNTAVRQRRYAMILGLFLFIGVLSFLSFIWVTESLSKDIFDEINAEPLFLRIVFGPLPWVALANLLPVYAFLNVNALASENWLSKTMAILWTLLGYASVAFALLIGFVFVLARLGMVG